MLKQILGVLVICGLFIGLFIGCGSGNSEGTAAELTKAEFVKQGNATCEKGFTRIAKAIASATAEEEKISKSQQQQRLFHAILPAYSEMVEDLRSLDTPVGEEKNVDAILSAYEEEIEALEADPKRAYSGHLLFVQPNKLANSYGLTHCAI